MSLRTLCAVAFACAAVAGSAHAALLTNGDFEAAYTPYALPPGWSDSVAVLGGPPLNAPDLFVVKGSDYIPCCGVTGSAGALANQFATFGAGDSPNAGGVLAQAFATVVGQTYVVSFDLAVFGIRGTQTLNAAIVDVPGAAVIASHDFAAFTDNDLDTAFGGHSFTFKATSALSRLEFRDTSPDTNSIDLVLDNASVAAAPEPGAWMLMIGGFGLLGAGLRRQRNLVGYAAGRAARR